MHSIGVNIYSHPDNSFRKYATKKAEELGIAPAICYEPVSSSLWPMNPQEILIKNSSVVLEIFDRMSKNFAQTLLVVTHDRSFAAQTGRRIEMEYGHIVI